MTRLTVTLRISIPLSPFPHSWIAIGIMDIRVTRWVPLVEHLRSPLVFVVEFMLRNLFLLCCPIICLYVLCSVLWCPLRFQHKNDVRFFFYLQLFVESSYSSSVMCLCLRIMLSNIFCVAFLFCFSSSYVPCHMLAVSLDCPLLIASSVFSSVYLALR